MLHNPDMNYFRMQYFNYPSNRRPWLRNCKHHVRWFVQKVVYVSEMNMQVIKGLRYVLYNGNPVVKLWFTSLGQKMSNTKQCKVLPSFHNSITFWRCCHNLRMPAKCIPLTHYWLNSRLNLNLFRQISQTLFFFLVSNYSKVNEYISRNLLYQALECRNLFILFIFFIFWPINAMT